MSAHYVDQHHHLPRTTLIINEHISYMQQSRLGDVRRWTRFNTQTRIITQHNVHLNRTNQHHLYHTHYYRTRRGEHIAWLTALKQRLPPIITQTSTCLKDQISEIWLAVCRTRTSPCRSPAEEARLVKSQSSCPDSSSGCRPAALITVHTAARSPPRVILRHETLLTSCAPRSNACLLQTDVEMLMRSKDDVKWSKH